MVSFFFLQIRNALMQNAHFLNDDGDLTTQMLEVWTILTMLKQKVLRFFFLIFVLRDDGRPFDIRGGGGAAEFFLCNEYFLLFLYTTTYFFKVT